MPSLDRRMLALEKRLDWLDAAYEVVVAKLGRVVESLLDKTAENPPKVVDDTLVDSLKRAVTTIHRGAEGLEAILSSLCRDREDELVAKARKPRSTKKNWDEDENDDAELASGDSGEDDEDDDRSDLGE